MKFIPFHLNAPKNSIEKSVTTQIFQESNSLAYHKNLPGYQPTPLIELNELAKVLGIKKLYIKDESYRFDLNAFKGLGASYAIHKLLERDPTIETFCTATDGNHGRAVAWSAKINGKQARVFVPKGTTAPRIEAIENEGAIVEVIQGNYEETCAYAKQQASDKNWTLVQDTAEEGYEEIPAAIKAGYFTHFIEMENELHSVKDPGVDVIFLQAGVGSWPAAAAWYYLNRYGSSKPKLVIVEPTEAAGLLASFKVGKRISPSGTFKTMMAGLNCGIPSLSAWHILKNTVDATIAVEDKFMEQAIRKLKFPQGQDPEVISGESGAGGMAGVLALMTDPRFEDVKKHLEISTNTRILVFSTEGATDPVNYEKIIKG